MRAFCRIAARGWTVRPAGAASGGPAGLSAPAGGVTGAGPGPALVGAKRR